MLLNNGGRKFLLAAVALLVSAIALFADKLDGDQWIWALGVILGLYGGANVGQKVFGKEAPNFQVTVDHGTGEVDVREAGAPQFIDTEEDEEEDEEEGAYFGPIGFTTHPRP